MTILLLLFLFLDIQHPPVSELPNQDFTVTDVAELSLGGCAMNPSDGKNNNADLTVEWIDSFKDQTDQPSILALPPEPLQIVQNRMVITNPVPPSPPEPPKPVATPEPPTIAILSITGLALLYLIFGYRRKLSKGKY